jgi:tetratricopeptide (TPR) repeat protein
VSSWRTATLDEIEPRERWLPIRDHLGITAFGINAWMGREACDWVIPEHSEEPTGHEELYLVLEGRARFTVDGEEVEAPAGTLVFVPDPEGRRGATALDPGTLVLSIGNKPGEAYSVQQWEQSWEYNQPAMQLYRQARYAEAADVLRKGVAAMPDNANLHYNLACFAALSGSTDEAFDHLRRSIELAPAFREAASADSDFDPIRHDPRFAKMLQP